MRIITLHPFDPWGSKWGGIETLIRLMLANAPAEHEPCVIGVTEDTNQRPVGQWLELEWKNRPVRFFAVMHESEATRRSLIPLSLRYSWALRRYSFDFSDSACIIHRPEPLALANIHAQRIALAFHSDPRDWTGPRSEVKWKYAPWLYRWLERRAVSQASSLLCVNQQAAECLSERYPNRVDSIHQVPVMFDDTLFHPADSDQQKALRTSFASRFDLEPDAKWILFAARLEQQKNPLLAIDAFAEALQLSENPEMQLIVAGDGSLKSVIEKQIDDLGINNQVHLTGALNQSDIANLMRASNLFLMTSFFEGTPIALIEALACGLPAVTTQGCRSSDVPGPTKSFVNNQGGKTEIAMEIIKRLNENVAFSPHFPDTVNRYTPASASNEWIQLALVQGEQ